MKTTDAANGGNDGSTDEQAVPQSGWEREIARSGHEYQPTEETAARRAAEILRDADEGEEAR